MKFVKAVGLFIKKISIKFNLNIIYEFYNIKNIKVIKNYRIYLIE